MDSLNQSLLTLFSYIRFPYCPGETIKVELVLNRLLELNLLTESQVEDIYEVLK